MDNDFNKTKDIVKKELASFLGTDPEDIEDDYSLTEDLHMKASDLTDFMQILTRMDYDTSEIDFTEIETFTDLVEALTSHQ